MNRLNAAPLFPKPVRFQDVDPVILAREELEMRNDPENRRLTQMVPGYTSWQSYLSRMLEPMDVVVRSPRRLSRG